LQTSLIGLGILTAGENSPFSPFAFLFKAYFAWIVVNGFLHVIYSGATRVQGRVITMPISVILRGITPAASVH